MAKGIIVVDKVPQTCQHIRDNKEDGCPYGGMVCQISNEDVMEHVKNGTKPDWCPIKQMPEKIEVLKYPHSMKFSRGWNACLNEIEGKM